MKINAGILSLSTIMVLAAYFLRLAMGKMIIISGKWWKRLLLLSGCWVLLSTVIFIGDSINILLAISFFLVITQFICEGSFWKKAVIGMIFSNTVFAFSALRDNYLLPVDARIINRGYAVTVSACCSLLFSFLLYMGIRKFAPDREYRLSESMWKLLLLLTVTPFGIVLSVVILHPLSDDTGFDFAMLLMIALFSIIGLLWTVTVLARQQKDLPQTSKPDKENHGIGLRSMKEIVERYHGAMELKAEGEAFEVFLYMPLQ